MTFLSCDPGWCVHKSDVQNKWEYNTHSHTNFQQSVYQPGMFANPARGQLNKEHIFSLSPFSCENLVAREDRFSRPVPREPAHSP